MNNQSLLTIAYPTYERAEAVEAAVEAALVRIDGLPIELLVADNGSTDGTVERLSRRFGGSGLRLIAGSENLGWAGNIARIATNASSEFIMLLSDEDDVADTPTLSELLPFLAGAQQLSLITTGTHLASSALNDLRAEHVWEGVHYISGNIFRRGAALKWAEAIHRVAQEHDIAELWEIYPHYMVAVGIWLSGDGCAHYPGDVYRTARDLPMRWRPSYRELGDRELLRTGQEALGRAYHKSISSNVLQHAALATFLDRLEGDVAIDSGRMKDIRRWQADRVAKKVDGLMAHFYPELYPAWRRGIRRRHSARRRVAAAIRHFMRRCAQ